MQTTHSLRTLICSVALRTALAFGATDVADFTEVKSPDSTSGGQFGASYGGLPDLTGDGVGEFYVFGNNRSYLYNGATLELLHTFIAPGCAVGIPIYSPGDLNGDGIPDLMLTKRCGTTLNGSVEVVDGETAVVLFTLESPNPVNQGFFGTTVRALGDLTGDGRPDWLIHQRETQTRVGRAYIFDSQTHSAVRTIQNNSPGFTFHMQVVDVIPDVDGDGAPELLVGSYQASSTRDGRSYANGGRVVVHSLQSSQVLYELLDPTPQSGAGFGFSFSTVGDVTGDHIADIAVGTYVKDNAAGSIAFFSGADGRWLRTLRAPRPGSMQRFGWAIESLPDLNGDGVLELLTQADGLGLAYVYDGATSTLLGSIGNPGPADAIFFTGTVRRQAPSGIQAYLFSAANAGNSGRVYYVPFKPFPRPTRVRPLGASRTGFRLEVGGEAGTKVEIQGTPDLRSWDSVGSVTLGNGVTEIEDSDATTRPQRFYRTVKIE